MKQRGKMAHKKIKSFALSAAMAMSGVFSACVERNEPFNPAVPEKFDKEPPEEITDKQKYFEHARDSVLVADGFGKYDAVSDTLAEIENGIYYDKFQSDFLEYDYTLGGVMTKSVFEKGDTILNRAYMEIALELARYKIPVEEHVIPDGDVFVYKNTMGEKKFLSRYNMCFIGIKTVPSDADVAWDIFSEQIISLIKNSVYNDGPKSDMLSKVSRIIEKAKQDLIASRRFIEKKYADYYLLEEGSRQTLGITHFPDNSYRYGYEDLNSENVNAKYLITERNVQVYDATLSVNFFGEPGAKYKLLSVGRNKWQVEKKSKNGKIRKTHVFVDNKEFTKQIVPAQNKKTFSDYDFNYTPGADMGVQVDYKEPVKIEQRRKDWVKNIPANTQNTIDSLAEQINQKTIKAKKLQVAVNRADSVANILTMARFNQKVR